MVRLRLLVWMIALATLLMPPALVAHAMAPAGPVASVDCPGHVPPDPCPAKGTAKHAAGDCCAQMTGAVALLPQAIAAGAASSLVHDRPARAASLAGRTFSQDPPPPRV